MMYDIDNLPGYIDLGQLSEKGAKEIEFDVTEWVTEHPTGTFSISYIRPTETTVYPVAAGDISTATALGVTTLTWEISDAVTAIAGAGSMVVQLAVADTVVKRSRLVQTIVQDGHAAAGDPPDPVQDWVADATSKLAETIAATEAANEAAGRANEISETMEGIAPLWADVGISVSALDEGAAPTASITQGETGTSISLGIPKGDTGAQGIQGEKGDKGDRVELTGPWDELTTYSYYQAAEYYGSSYIYINDTPSAGHSPLDTDYWMLWAARGEQFVDTTNLTWQGVRDVVRQGLGPKVFPVGSVLRTTHTTYGDILWRVMAHNHDVHKADPTRPTMRLEMISCIYNRQVDAPELLWANTGAAELPAGTYNFTLLKADNAGDIREDGTYQFTTEQAIPVGGGFRHSQAGRYRSSSELYVPANIIGNHLTTYDASGVAIESNLAVTSGSGGTALGTASRNWADTVNIIGRFNSTQRNAYGSNHAGESGVRQWLNSDLGANLWWVKKTPFDLKPSYANQPGFLAGFDADFLDALVTVDNICARNTIYEEGGTLGGSYVTADKMFRPSMTELGLGVNNAIAEGAVLDYYEGTTALERIKFDIAIPETARCWWLRSPNPSYADNVRSILQGGALGNYSASGGIGVAPDCVIG